MMMMMEMIVLHIIISLFLVIVIVIITAIVILSLLAGKLQVNNTQCTVCMSVSLVLSTCVLKSPVYYGAVPFAQPKQLLLFEAWTPSRCEQFVRWGLQ